MLDLKRLVTAAVDGDEVEEFVLLKQIYSMCMCEVAQLSFSI